MLNKFALLWMGTLDGMGPVLKLETLPPLLVSTFSCNWCSPNLRDNEILIKLPLDTGRFRKIRMAVLDCKGSGGGRSPVPAQFIFLNAIKYILLMTIKKTQLKHCPVSFDSIFFSSHHIFLEIFSSYFS